MLIYLRIQFTFREQVFTPAIGSKREKLHAYIDVSILIIFVAEHLEGLLFLPLLLLHQMTHDNLCHLS